MKVRIENKSSAAITVKGRHTIRIPAADVLETVLPDSEQIHKTLSRLRREYPALKIEIAGDDATPETASAPVSGHAEVPASDAPETPMAKEAFLTIAKASKGSGDKWNVNVEGLKTFKIREATDEAAAIDLAYAEYLEAFSAPATK